uniref:Auxin-responsive protein SAUR32 n=1 Tax=Triticum urartu TaxID=4572 RepID=A0A8R7P222_TRIUA
MIKKGCATFLVGEEVEDGATRRFTVPVELLVHPRIMELLAEAEEKYGYAHEGAIVLPCGVERFQKAVDEARAQERHRRHQHHHHHHFSLSQLVGCFRPAHFVV